MEKKEMIKKSILVGVGLAAFAQESAEKLVKELLKKGHVSKEQGKKIIRSVTGEAQKSGKRVAAVLEGELKRLVKLSGITKKTASKETKKKAAKKKK